MSVDSTTCRSCGKGLLPTDAFCSGCGIPVRARGFDVGEERRTLIQEAVPTAQRRHCRSCNAPLFPGDSFCAGCGVTIAQPMEASPLADSGTQLRFRIEEASQGRYQVLREIGRGGMGVVLLAEDRDLRRKVAIKVLSGGTADPATLERFEREARTVAQLRHESIVRVHAVGGVGDLHYFVMDYVAGVSLQRILAARGKLSIPMVEAVLFRVGIGLAYAHTQPRPVIHRDIKPSNIIIDTDGLATLMDFGVAKVGDDAVGLTRTGMIVGTPEYMSPEQVRSLPVTPATDQYALGAVAFAMLTGRPPFSGPFYEVLIAHQREPVPDILAVRPDCPPALASAVQRMLAKEPDQRWPDLPTLLRELGLRPLSPYDTVVQEMAALAEALGAGDLVGPDSLAGGSAPSRDGPTTGRLRIGLPRDHLEVGESMSLELAVELPDGQVSSPGELSWSMDPPGVVEVDPRTGELVAVGAGVTRVTARGAGIGGSVDLEVTAPEVTRVVLSPEKLALSVGEARRLQGTTLSRSGTPLDHPRTWASSDPTVVSVSPDGEVKALRAGAASVVLYCDSGWAAVAVQVAEAPKGAATAAPDRVPAGKVDRGPVTTGIRPPPRGVITTRRGGTGGDNGRAPARRAIYAVGGVAAVAVLASAAWFLRPAGSGDAPPPVAPGALVIVDPSGAPVDGGIELAPGERLQLALDGADADAAEAVWTSSAPDVVTVQGAALAGVTPGTAEITAFLEGRTAAFPVTVRAPWAALDVRSPAGASLQGEALVLAEGGSQPLAGVLLDEGGVAVEGPEVAWSSSDAAVADYSGGAIRARGPGAAVLTARAGGLEASVRVRVDAAPVTRPTQQPAPPPAETRAPPVRTDPAPVERPPTTAAPVGRGRLLIVVTPGWANAFVDGQPIGEYRTQYDIELDAGTYDLRLENPAFAPADTTVTIRPGETTRWERRLGNGRHP